MAMFMHSDLISHCMSATQHSQDDELFLNLE